MVAKMTFYCKIGLHSWNGCKCTKCSKVRNEEHDWSRDCDKCSKCGQKRKDQHDWNGCKCNNCGKIRDEQHDWSSDCEECSICSKKRIITHTWDSDLHLCVKCGISRIDMQQVLIESIEFNGMDSPVSDITALSEICDMEGFMMLVKCMQINKKGISDAILAAALRIGTFSIYPLLEEMDSSMLYNPDIRTNVITKARYVLDNFEIPDDMPPGLLALYYIYSYKQSEAVKIGSQVVEELIERLECNGINNLFSHGIVEVLGEIGDHRAIEPLITLSNAGGSISISKVLNKFNVCDQIPLPQRAKILAQARNVDELTKLDIVIVEKLLYELIGLFETFSRDTIVESLGKHGSEGVEPLIRYIERASSLSDSSVNKAIEILGELKDVRALEVLGNTIKNNPIADFRPKAFKALVTIGAPALDTLSKLLNYSSFHYDYYSQSRSNDTENVRRSAINSISQIDDPQVIPILKGIISDEHRASYEKRNAADALIKLGDKSAQDEINRQNRTIDLSLIHI